MGISGGAYGSKVINKLAYIPQYGDEVTATAKQHKEVPDTMSMSQLFHFTQHIKYYSNSVSQPPTMSRI